MLGREVMSEEVMELIKERGGEKVKETYLFPNGDILFIMEEGNQKIDLKSSEEEELM